jgi:hypothetical protein
MNLMKIGLALMISAGSFCSAAAQRIASDKTTKDGVRIISTNAVPVYNGELFSVAASAMIKDSDTAYFIGFYKHLLDLGTDIKNDSLRNSCIITLADGSTVKGEYVQIIQVPGNDILSYHLSNDDFKNLALQDAVNASFMSPVTDTYDFKILKRFQSNTKNVAAKILKKLK